MKTAITNNQKVAFHSISTDYDNIRKGVIALCGAMGLSNGSISARANPLEAYDLYDLLYFYMNNTNARLKTHDLMKGAAVQDFH